MHPLTIVVVSRLAKIASKHFTSSDTFPSLVLPGDCCFWKQRREEYKKKTLALISKRKEEEESEKQERKNKESEKRKKQQKKKKKKKRNTTEGVILVQHQFSGLFFFFVPFHSHHLYTVLPSWRLDWLPMKWPRITRIPWKISLRMTGSKSAI